MLDGMQRISQEDREQLMGMSTRALDSAPPDCGGAKNLQVIMSRYLSLETESDEELRTQLQAMFNLLKQSTGNTPPPQITAAQRLRGQLALSTSIADALKQNSSETDDLGLLVSGEQADLAVRRSTCAPNATRKRSRGRIQRNNRVRRMCTRA
ncbi:hypothetical protein [Caballeronia sp.]|uniref:hypothetical protein n=1 Tax=Caballeronia sp. TaxID=1931223 RepID=UPI003C6F8298